MSHHSTVLMFHVSPPSLLGRLDSTLVSTRSRMGTSRLLASGGFDKGNGHSRSMLTRDLGPYPFKSPQSSVAPLCKLHVGGVLDLWCRKVVWQSGENFRPDQTGDLVKNPAMPLPYR